MDRAGYKEWFIKAYILFLESNVFHTHHKSMNHFKKWFSKFKEERRRIELNLWQKG